MTTLTIRLPDDKHHRLKALAIHQKISINKLIEQMTTQTLAEFDSENRFRMHAAAGNAQRGLELLDKLDTLSNQT